MAVVHARGQHALQRVSLSASIPCTPHAAPANTHAASHYSHAASHPSDQRPSSAWFPASCTHPLRPVTQRPQRCRSHNTPHVPNSAPHLHPMRPQLSPPLQTHTSTTTTPTHAVEAAAPPLQPPHTPTQLHPLERASIKPAHHLSNEAVGARPEFTPQTCLTSSQTA
jgi:hypothetical protein